SKVVTGTRIEHAGMGEPVSAWPSAFQGVFAGVGLTVVAVAVGTLIFGTYGYGIFLLTPFVIGAVTAYVANLRADMGAGETALVDVMAVLVGSLMLGAVGVEGGIFVIMAGPLGLAMAGIGGLLWSGMGSRVRR